MGPHLGNNLINLGIYDTARQAVELKRQQVSNAVHAGRAAAQQAREDLERRIAETKASYDAGAAVARTRARTDASRTSRAPRS